ncbi:RDD family protein [Confluentibacter citreus]|uniref:RDD family protein n=1 Tax=Confluentibacter citreus TaxID=2007307 RepID=UPI0012FE6234|nr:RDD family protein [Confluentibacter citreus]
MVFENFAVTPDLYASKGSRFINYIIDLIFFMVFAFGTLFLLATLFYAFAEDTSLMDNFITGLENINPLLDRLLTAMVLALLYFSTETLLKGRTLGKYITKTKVVLIDGTNPNALDYLKRSFSRVIPFEALSFLGAEGRGWHDTISKTYVVDIQKYQAKLKAYNSLEQIGKNVENE